jgi:hypothetical protein
MDKQILIEPKHEAVDLVSVPKGFSCQDDGHSIVLSVRPPFSWPVIVRVILTCGTIYLGVNLPGSFGFIMLLSGITMCILVLLLLHRTIVTTRIELDSLRGQIRWVGFLGTKIVEAPISEFRIDVVGDLYEKSGEGPDQVPVHYLRVTLKGVRHRLFVGHKRRDVEWARILLSRRLISSRTG